MLCKGRYSFVNKLKYLLAFPDPIFVSTSLSFLPDSSCHCKGTKHQGCKSVLDSHASLPKMLSRRNIHHEKLLGVVMGQQVNQRRHPTLYFSKIVHINILHIWLIILIHHQRGNKREQLCDLVDFSNRCFIVDRI